MKSWKLGGGLALAASVAVAATMAFAQSAVAPSPNGLTIPEGYKDWRVISVSQRSDNNTLRVIIGNDIAIEAVRAGNMNPWPDGAIIGKVVYGQVADPEWPAALVPETFRAAEFMYKDAAAHSATAGWGWARWLGTDQRPFGVDNPQFANDCVACHTPVAGNDYVFTQPVQFP